MPNDKSKTSKTARVMNLLSKKPAASAPAPEMPAGEAGAPIPEEAKPAPHSPPILSSIGADAAASDQIKNALEDALAEELDRPASQSAPAPAPESAFEPAPEPVHESASAPAPEPVHESVSASAPAPAREPEPEQPAPRPEPDEPTPAASQPTAAAYQAILEHEPEQLGYINVMQVLVEEKAPKYVRMFGLCDCKRCLEDVKALALNHLPPKYVVMAENEMIPKLTFYEGRYSSDITAQLLKACSKVAERPHHTRD